jgi:hypothetical protein
LRAWCFLDTQGHSEEAEDTRDSAKADVSHDKQLKSSPNQVSLVLHGEALALGLQLTQASLGLFECFVGVVSLVFDPSQLLALVAIFIGSLRGFGLPWLSALSDFGPLAHPALCGQDRPPQATGAHAVRGR